MRILLEFRIDDEKDTLRNKKTFLEINKAVQKFIRTGFIITSHKIPKGDCPFYKMTLVHPEIGTDHYETNNNS